MALPNSYSEMYPNRFLKADLLKGQKVTLTVKDIIGEELTGDDEKSQLKWILRFVERPLELVIPKVNGECFRRMFGNDPHTAIGKRVTLFPTKTKAFGQVVDCIRIWGSPDLEADMPISVRDGGGRKRKEMVMHKVAPGTCGWRGDGPTAASKPSALPSVVDPRISAAWGILGIAEGAAHMAAFTGDAVAYLAYLNRLIDANADPRGGEYIDDSDIPDFSEAKQ